MDIAERIRIIMKECGLKQVDLANAASVNPAAISQIVSGKTNPSAQTVQMIADAYGYSAEWIMTGEGEPRAQKNRKQQIMDLTAKMLQAEEESFISRVGAALSELTPDEWEVFESFCKKLLKDRPKEGE